MYYTVALIFSRDRSQIALIRKQKPAWQVGKLNGIGGKVEDCEGIDEAASRELFEESRLRVPSLKVFAVGAKKKTVTNSEDLVFFYTGTADLKDAYSNEAEQIEILNIQYALSLPDLIANLRWLIPLALDTTSGIARFEILELK